MEINIKRETENIESENKWRDSRPRIREVSVGVGLPKMLAYWSTVSRWALILFAALAPIFFLPFTNLPVAANKEILVFSLIIIAFFALLGRVLIEGRVRYPGHFLALALLLLILVWGASAFFSLNQLTSLVGAWASPDSFFSMLAFVILALSIATTFDRRDIVASLLVFIASLSLLGLFELLQLTKIFILPFEFAKNSGFNPVGSINDVGVLLAFGLVIVSGLMSADLSARANMSGALKKFLGLSVVIFILNLAIIDFWAIWAGLILAMIFMISFLSQGIKGSNKSIPGILPSPPANSSIPGIEFSETEYQGLQLEYFRKAWLPSIILLIALLFVFIPSPLSKFVQTPIEVSPTFSATLDIGVQNLSAGHYLLGSGPGTFGYIFNLYKPNGINQTIFWATVFNGGASAMFSWVGTAGVLGILALLLLIAAFVWTGIAGTSIRNASTGIMNVASQALFVGVCYLFIMWFLYGVNFTIMVFAFWGIGLFLAASLFFMKEDRSNETDRTNRTYKSVLKELRIFTSPPKTFLFSLLIVGLMVVSIIGLYFESNRYIAEIYFAKQDYASAIKFWRYDEKYFQGLSQSVFIKLNDLLANKDIPQEEAKAQFQDITTRAVAAAQEALRINPQNTFNSVLMGNIYENLVPFVADAANFALSSYGGAVALDPQNPSNYLALARVKIAQKNWGGAASDLEKSISLKNDYAPARFLLVQVYDQQGKLADAVRRAEELVSLNVNDVGALFQLGFLYYKNSQFDRARPVMERIIELSPNYSNARYFLGLIYDRDAQMNQSSSAKATEDRNKAIEEFRKIAELNPDNKEIARIITNLKTKKPALFGITPPAPAPQNRTEAPVQEGAKAPVQPLKK